MKKFGDITMLIMRDRIENEIPIPKKPRSKQYCWQGRAFGLIGIDKWEDDDAGHESIAVDPGYWTKGCDPFDIEAIMEPEPLVWTREEEDECMVCRKI